VRRALEAGFAPAGHWLGWRPQFPWSRFESWLACTPDIRLIERRSVPPLGHFSLIRFGKVASATETARA
jgi:phosphatidylethanolamine/phosphatidyl-N-methylethanolamine N-methyltransferase